MSVVCIECGIEVLRKDAYEDIYGTFTCDACALDFQPEDLDGLLAWDEKVN
jgi:hypothetical protein